MSSTDIHAVGLPLSPSSAVLSPGQSLLFTMGAGFGGGAKWALSQPVGTITDGYYVAPSVISAPETVAVIATSNSNQMGTAVISLMPGASTPTSSGSISPGQGSLSISPNVISLSANQIASFTALMNGSGDAAVAWSIQPKLGTMWSGMYQAPSSIFSPQIVMVTATNLNNPTQTATATISLNANTVASTNNQSLAISQANVSLTPTSATLSSGQGAMFSAVVTGASSSAVSWSISPAVGTVTNGYYQAPKAITANQTVTLTATSLADPSQSASVPIHLNAPWGAGVAPPSPNNNTGSVQSVRVNPSSVSLVPGQSTLFTLTVGGMTAAGSWSLIPNIGTIVNGYYTAPSVVSAPTSVTLVATPTNSSQTASAAITLQPSAPPAPPSVSISLSPASISLTAGQKVQFGATVSGSSNTAVTWSLSPAVGSLSNGLYTAPVTVSQQQAVTIKATSSADSTKSASAVVTLTPVAVSLKPGSISLTAGGSAQFMATVTGSSNTSVTWSLSPQVGSVTNGLYKAPATISSNQTVTLTAASVADSTKTAKATISLAASGGSLTVSPGAVSLGASKTQQFSASLSSGLGGGAASLQWSINPVVGSISSSGLYTAPASISTSQNVSVIATGSGTSASATVILVPPTPAPAPTPTQSNIVLPLEVVGPNGTTVPASFNVPSGANVSGSQTLSMQIHGLRFGGQASVQVNNSGWLPISSSTVTLLGLANAYGGIGGGFHTLQMTMNLPAGVVTTGANTITFKFNGTDGRVSGFRVLGFNIQDANGNQFINPSSFVWDDPNAWTPPSSSSSDISAGQTLWRTASLTTPTSSGTQTIQAHCMDCHTQDGRDLKYFNYSNKSIQARSMFHGLTAQQGNQIASYIRSLNVPNPGRPWNPPYQPGPGLDSQPVQNWSAGAGLSAVLDSDAEMMSQMFPSGIQSSYFSNTSVENIRETQLALQMPDWNSWLPTIHPMDAFSDFTSSPFFGRYGILRSELVPGDPASYAKADADFRQWAAQFLTYRIPKEQAYKASGWTVSEAQDLYSLSLWAMVKAWELHQEFQLEGMAKTVFTNPKAEARAWDSEFPFLTSPNMTGIPKTLGALDNGLTATWQYLSMIWYHSQLILNNSEYQQTGTAPIDWGYAYGMVKDLGGYDSQPQAALMTTWLTKGLQISNNGIAPNMNSAETGWNPASADISRLVSPGFMHIWMATPQATRTAVYSGLVEAYLASVTQFTPQQFWAAGVNAAEIPAHGQPDGDWADKVWYMIPQFRYWGVSQTYINQLAAWAQTIWPNVNWTPTTTATCYMDGSGIFARCSTEQ